MKIPPFYQQETEFSCAVACLRMVLAHRGMLKTEPELRELCDCTIFGTPALNLVLAARKLGFTASCKHTLTLPDISDLTENGYFPIVYLVSAPGIPPDVHSVVAISVDAESLTVLDPKQRQQTLSIDDFVERWSL